MARRSISPVFKMHARHRNIYLFLAPYFNTCKELSPLHYGSKGAAKFFRERGTGVCSGVGIFFLNLGNYAGGAEAVQVCLHLSKRLRRSDTIFGMRLHNVVDTGLRMREGLTSSNSIDNTTY